MSRENQIQSIIELLAKIQRPALSNRWREFGLSHAQVGMLFLLSIHKRTNVKQAADFLGVSKSAVTQLADPLESKGLISRDNDHDDRRIVWLGLTQNGAKILKTIAKHKFEGVRSAIDGLDDKELKLLYGLLQKAAAQTKNLEPETIKKA